MKLKPVKLKQVKLNHLQLLNLMLNRRIPQGTLSQTHLMSLIHLVSMRAAGQSLKLIQLND